MIGIHEGVATPRIPGGGRRALFTNAGRLLLENLGNPTNIDNQLCG